MTGSLGKRYARALVELARADQALDPVGADVARAAAAFEEPRLRAVVLNPAIAGAARRQIVRQVVGALGLAANVGNLVRLLADRDRLPILSDVARWYETLVDEELGRTRVRIRSAAPLSASERADLADLARRLTRRREVVVGTEVDPDLLGGVVLDAGGTVYDGSVSTQLVGLSKEMAEAAT